MQGLNHAGRSVSKTENALELHLAEVTGRENTPPKLPSPGPVSGKAKRERWGNIKHFSTNLD